MRKLISEKSEVSEEKTLDGLESSGDIGNPELNTLHSRFTIVSEGDEKKWNLPNEMADYINKNSNVYILKKDIDSKILLENPVPNNVTPVQTIDDYLVEIIKEKGKTSSLSLEAVFEKVQKQNMAAFGPLSRLWDIPRLQNVSHFDEISGAAN